MKVATRLLIRHEARVREADDLRSLRQPPGLLLPAHGHRPASNCPVVAPYRLQAADRWWQETARPRPASAADRENP